MPRALPLASAALVGLLLLDAVFVIAHSAAPQGAFASVISAMEVAAPTTVPTRVPTRAPTSAPAKLPTRSPRRVLPTPTAVPAVATAEAYIVEMGAQPTTEACPNPIGQLVTETVQSKVIGAPLPVNVYLPPCYKPNESKYPTLYLIQGNNHEIGGWIDIGTTRVADVQMSLGTLPPFIIVMPANGQYGRNPYTWSLKGPNSYEGFLVNELVPYIDGKFSTWGERNGRAIGGISRGGYWSIEAAFSNPGVFSIMGAHSPSITDKLIGVGANFTMLNYARTMTDVSTLRIWIDSGDRDWARKDANKLASDLDRIKVPYQLSVGEGIHEDATWANRVADYLAFYSSTWPRIPKAVGDVTASDPVQMVATAVLTDTASTESTTAPTAEATTEATVEVTDEATPEVAPTDTPEFVIVSPEATEGVTEGATDEPTPDPALEDVPGDASGDAPQVTPTSDFEIVPIVPPDPAPVEATPEPPTATPDAVG